MKEDIQKFTHYLLEGDEVSCESFINEMPDKEDVIKVFHFLTTAMQHIGELWENNEITVADEHLATATCDYVLSQYKYNHITRKKGKSNGLKAMFFCLENEQHYLGTKIVSSIFEYYGWETRLFGANLPLEYAESQAKEWKPQLIGISVAILYHLPKLKGYLDALSRIPNAPIMMVGGRLSGLYDLRQYSTEETIILKSIQDVQRWIMEHRTEGNKYGENNKHSSSLFSNQ
ncbi:B12-binding domain-containing protein [Pseudalkalibacillus sp. SCS-8]|uniref:cobalamin B12-binding domain-containing protein n=1 Tax=Pseudalkalibacillus nanhaiensis TaxID=3115291 RepID=UPI0032DB1364